MPKRLLVYTVILSMLLVGCARQKEIPVPIEPVTAPQPEILPEYFEVNAKVPTAPIQPSVVDNTSNFNSVTIIAYTNYKDKKTVLSETQEYRVKNLKQAKLLYQCSAYKLPVMIKVDRKNNIKDWYVVNDNNWYKPEDLHTLKDLYRSIVNDVTNSSYPIDVGTTGKLAGTVKYFDEGIAQIVVNGKVVKVFLGDTYDNMSSHVELNIVMKDNNMWCNTDVNEVETETLNNLDYTCPIGYSEIKPLEYGEVTNGNNVHIKGGGEYITSNEYIAELITIAYYSGLNVYIKTGESLFEIIDYIIVDNKTELNIKSTEELMSYVNARYQEKVKPGSHKATMRLRVVTPSINLYEGVSDFDAIDKRPFYSYHYVVMEDPKHNNYILKFTSGTKGLDYLDLDKKIGRKLKCKYTQFTLHDVDGNHYNYVIDEVR